MARTSLADDTPQVQAPGDIEMFEKEVRPVLAEHCFSCHGAKKQESGLRLDSRSGVLAGGDSGPAVAPGKPGESFLIEAIAYESEPKMPPKGKLPPQAIDALTRWVALGLPWPELVQSAVKQNEVAEPHWSLQPVVKPPVPEVREAKWPQTDIDRFMLARLEERGLAPSPPANRQTLIRRATFDLIGLPPTPEEAAAFLADESPDAYANLIDRLLASNRYGERWARHWLDVARYADTKGYVFFEDQKLPWAYTYRDYVIRALNEDLPYDRFILEQLAADQLDLGDDQRPLAALGFLTVGDRFMNNQHDILDDRIDVITRGLLGLTVTCARCHDHKFDPIPQADYYSLYGVLRSSHEPTVPPLVDSPPDTEEYQKFKAELDKRQQQLNEFVETKHNALIHIARNEAGRYLLAAHEERNKPPTDDFMLLADKGDLNPTMIIRWRNYLQKSRRNHHPVWAPWHVFAELPEDDFAAQAVNVAATLTNSPAARPINPLVRQAVLQSPPQSMQDLANRYGALVAQIESRWQSLLKHTADAGAPVPTAFHYPAEEELRQVLYGEDAPPNVPQVFGWGFLTLFPDRPTQDEYKKLLKPVEEWLTTGPGAPPRAMAVVESQQPFEPYIFLRGNPNRRGPMVSRHFLTCLTRETAPFQNGSGRLELARAIVDPENPLTARVIVNRVWQHHFGRGIVGTPSDFGRQGESPTHPALLDYLAATFMEEGWSLKKLHRRIMLSAVYRQATEDRDASLKVDPENRLLWKMNRRRLDFETLRDALLAVSGSLDPAIGGRSVDISGGFVPRRTVYGHIDRMNLPGMFRTFDFPSPTASAGRRAETTVPPQALYMMNNNFVIEAAGRLLSRPDVASLADQDKMVRVYQIVFGRLPSDEEQAFAREFFTEQSAADRWVLFVQALLMTNEFAFLD